MKGYVHLYTGDGKGKTTAAMGQAIRAAGAGKKVFIAQFAKGQPFSEAKLINQLLPAITIKQYGLECFIINLPTEKDKEVARRGLNELLEIIRSDLFDLIILDEANIAIFYNLYTSQELIGVLRQKPESTEIVITGRYATQEMIDFSDLVTEMVEVKHYYQKGVVARKGIEY
jgi:cob(I)alamin adenosyltransferase